MDTSSIVDLVDTRVWFIQARSLKLKSHEAEEVAYGNIEPMECTRKKGFNSGETGMVFKYSRLLRLSFMYRSFSEWLSLYHLVHHTQYLPLPL